MPNVGHLAGFFVCYELFYMTANKELRTWVEIQNQSLGITPEIPESSIILLSFFPFPQDFQTSHFRHTISMPKNRSLRKLMPASKGPIIQSPESGPPIQSQSKVSLACTECKKKRTKCSGTIPCARCIAKGCDCIYNPRGDRRSKAYIAELLGFRAAFCRIITTLRSGTHDEISWLAWEIQRHETDQEAISCLTEGHQGHPDL